MSPTRTSTSPSPWLRASVLALAITASLAMVGCGKKGADAQAKGPDGKEEVKLGPDGKPLPKVEAVPVEVARAAPPPNTPT
jgi:hypothetical protein